MTFKTDVFDELIDRIYSKKHEIHTKKPYNSVDEFIPKIYYIGTGKTGSTSICRGFSVNAAHWHSITYFEKLYNTNLLTDNDYDLYDFVRYIGKKYKFKPVIIEATRNPIDVEISSIFQHLKFPCSRSNCELCKIKYSNNIKDNILICKKHIIEVIEKDTRPVSIDMYQKHFNIDLTWVFDKKLNYFFSETHDCFLLFLKFENIQNWQKIINKTIPYEFTLYHSNKGTHSKYNIIKNNLFFTGNEITILDNYIFKSFYTKEEILKMKHKYIR